MNTRRFMARLRISIHTLYKIIVSRPRLRFKRFHQILIDKQAYRRINKSDQFVTSVQLARFINTITSAQRVLLRIPDNGRLPNTKDRIEFGYIYAAILYEMLQAMSKLFGKLRRLAAWETCADLVAEFNRERSDKASYYNQVLQPLRNEIAFHFDESAVRESVDLVKMKDSIVLASSDSTLSGDMVFNLVDDLVLNWIISKDVRPISEMEKFDAIMKYTLGLSEKIRRFCSECILEIWAPWAHRECTRLAS